MNLELRASTWKENYDARENDAHLDSFVDLDQISKLAWCKD